MTLTLAFVSVKIDFCISYVLIQQKFSRILSRIPANTGFLASVSPAEIKIWQKINKSEHPSQKKVLSYSINANFETNIFLFYSYFWKEFTFIFPYLILLVFCLLFSHKVPSHLISPFTGVWLPLCPISTYVAYN